MARFVRWLAVAVLLGPVGGALGQEKPLTRVAFGSCADQNKPCPVWARIAEQKPDLLVLLGDNIYADLEDGKLVATNPAKIADAYKKLAAEPAFKALRDRVPILATWDDHDYGKNDAGADYPYKDESQKLFLNFWNVPADSPRRQRKGVYHAETFGPPGKRVQVILLDERYHRSPLKKAAGPLPGTRIVPYLPNTDPGATFLGEEQWKWLEEQLRQPADLRLIGSGVQVVADEHPFEKLANIPAERDRLYKLIRDTAATGVVLLSGDRHLGELSLDTAAIDYPLYDLTSSGFNQASKEWRPPEKNRHRVAAMPYGDNFGLIVVDWSADPTVSLQLRDDTGEIVLRQTIPLRLLQPQGKAQAKLPEGVIGPADAIRKVGQAVTVQMAVKSGRALKERILLNSEADYRSEKNFTVVLNQKAWTGKWAKAGFDTFKGKTIRATGTVTLYKDAPQIQVDDETKIEIVEEKK